jgi:hypothetical protein
MHKINKISRVDFLKNIHSAKYSNAFTAFLFSAGSTGILRENLNRVGKDNLNERKNDLIKIKRRYDVMICRLKKDGLITDNVSITRKGLRLINLFLKKDKKKLPTHTYERHESKTTTLITFDIPEKLRRYRDWFRGVLKLLGFEMLQKSVWIGRIKIPVQLLLDLKGVGLVEYVEILEISKTGSIERPLK